MRVGEEFKKIQNMASEAKEYGGEVSVKISKYYVDLYEQPEEVFELDDGENWDEKFPCFEIWVNGNKLLYPNLDYDDALGAIHTIVNYLRVCRE